MRVGPEHSSCDRPSFQHVGACCDTPHTALSSKGTTGCEASLSVFKSHLSTYCPFALIYLSIILIFRLFAFIYLLSLFLFFDSQT